MKTQSKLKTINYGIETYWLSKERLSQKIWVFVISREDDKIDFGPVRIR